MSKRNALLLLKDILDSTRLIEEYSSGMNYEVFCKDTKTRDAVVRNFEIIGEAANNLPMTSFKNTTTLIGQELSDSGMC